MRKFWGCVQVFEISRRRYTFAHNINETRVYTEKITFIYLISRKYLMRYARSSPLTMGAGDSSLVAPECRGKHEH